MNESKIQKRVVNWGPKKLFNERYENCSIVAMGVRLYGRENGQFCLLVKNTTSYEPFETLRPHSLRHSIKQPARLR